MLRWLAKSRLAVDPGCQREAAGATSYTRGPMGHDHAAEPRFTYGDYVQWEGDERWELVYGVPFLMSPAPGTRHQLVVTELARQVGNHLAGGPCRVFVAPFDVRLADGDEEDAAIRNVVQPDLSVVCDPAKLDEASCRGAPDWIVEVVSPRTAARDRLEKRHLYERHGVEEYWIVDPEKATVVVYRRDLASGRFASPEAFDTPVATGCVTLPRLVSDRRPML